MAVLERDQVVARVAKRDVVRVDSLGADVIVRSRMLEDRLAVNSLQASMPARLDGETDADAQARIGSAVVSKVLSLQVILEDGRPLQGAEAWALHGADHPEEVLHLYEVCQRLSGADAEALAKNSQPSRIGASPSSSRPGWVARFKNWARG